MTLFAGMPVQGSPEYAGNQDRPQRKAEELERIVRAVVDDPRVVALGWQQYTPYFNDGDTCVFGANSAWVRLRTDPEFEDKWELSEALSYGPRHGDPILAPFRDAIEDGYFDSALLKLFGDHAQVTIEGGVVEIESFEHE